MSDVLQGVQPYPHILVDHSRIGYGQHFESPAVVNERRSFLQSLSIKKKKGGRPLRVDGSGGVARCLYTANRSGCSDYSVINEELSCLSKPSVWLTRIYR